VIVGDYKLILYPEIEKALLFNLRRDPLEIRDLSGKKGSRDRMRELFEVLQELQENLGDPLDLAQIYPELG
jgi:hypothetical protein